MNFSIVVPAKNEEDNIERCLQSVLSVSWDRTDFEVLLMDNGSSDRTVEIARSLGVTCFVRPGDTIARLRNFGAGQSRGNILVFLDADCTVHPSWLREASRYVEQRDVVCFGSPPIVPSNGTWVQKAWFQVRKKKGGPGETDWLESMNMFVRRELFERIGGFNEDLITCEDYDLSLRLKQMGRLVADDRIIAVHHGEAASLARFFRKELWRGTSNLKGIASHGFSMTELPSLVIPLVYGILAAVNCLFFSMTVIGLIDPRFTGGFLLLWQVPLMLLALSKSVPPNRLPSAVQLYLLFNVYFAARAGAILPGRR